MPENIVFQSFPESKPKRRAWFTVLLLALLSLLLSFPLFIIIYRYVPDIKLPVGDGVRIDHYLTAILIFLFNYLVVRVFRNIVIGLIIAFSIVLITNEIRNEGRYGISHMIEDYKNLIFYIKSEPIEIPFLKEFKPTIRDAKQIREAIDYNNPVIRNFAVQSATRYFTDKTLYNKYRQTLRYFSVFKSIRDQWQYIHDPAGEEYYAKASETIMLMAGDCDDYSICMAACIKAIGGDVRLIRTKRHIYPEVKICPAKQFQHIHYLIKEVLFTHESKGKRVYYHLHDGFLWLNFDYSAYYPGGEFLDEEIQGLLEI